jgi:hypothetical protein
VCHLLQSLLPGALKLSKDKPIPSDKIKGFRKWPALREICANPCWLVATIVLVAWSCFDFPEETLTQLPDPSWGSVLIHAHKTGMQFGRDIVFTYGPLGFLTISSFSPDIAVMRIFFEVAIGFVIVTGLCLVAWRLAIVWRCLLLGFFVLVSTTLHWGSDALYADLGIFLWGLLCFLESGRRIYFFAVMLVVLAAVGGLIKITFLVTGVFTIGLLACDLMLRGRRALAAGMVTGLLLALIAGWSLLGQSISGIGSFLSMSFVAADGYNKAMGLNFAHVGWILLMAAATLLAAAIRCFSMPIAEARSPNLRRALLLVWITGLVFLNWKYMSVRADYYHLKLLFGFIPVVALCLEAIPVVGLRLRNWSLSASLCCLFIAVSIIQSQIHHKFFPVTCVEQTCRDMSASYGVLLHPARYLREKTEAFHAEQELEQLPKIRAAVGRSTIDVFGQNQAPVFANELNYLPRPIFQSYAAFGRQMMELNEQFYFSGNAPEFVLFNLQPIDDRFPPLEDAFVLRDLLANYKLVFSEKDFLLLQRKAGVKPRLILVREGIVKAGEPIDLPGQPAADLWLEVDLKPTLMGKLWEFLYKPAEVQLVARRQSESMAPHKFRAPAVMLSAGFLASPSVLNNGDVTNLYGGDKPPRFDSYEVEPASNLAPSWQSPIHYRLLRIEWAIPAQSP